MTNNGIESFGNVTAWQEMSVEEQESLVARLDRDRTVLKVINAFALDLITILSKEALAWHVAREVVGKLGFVDCVVYFLDHEKKHLRQQAAIGEKKNPVSKEIVNVLEIPLGEGISGHVAQTKKPLIVDDLEKDGRYIPDVELARSEICVPLIIDDQVVGVIDCEDRRVGHFNAFHLEILSTVAAMTSARLKLISQGQTVEIAEKLVERESQLRASEERFRGIFDYASTAIVTADDKGSLTAWNGAFRKMLGYEDGELETISFSDITHPDDLASSREHLGKLLRGEIDSFQIEKRWVRKDGSFCWGEICVAPLRNSKRQVIGSIATILDISERKKTEAALDESRQELEQKSALLQATFESIGQGFAVWDAELRLVAWNRNCLDYWYDLQGVQVGMPMQDLLRHIAVQGQYGPGEPDALASAQLQRVLTEGRESEEEIKLLDGRTAHLRRYPMPDGGHASVYTDVTERKQAEQALSEKTTHLELLHSITAAANEAFDVCGVLEKAVSAVCTRLGWPVGHVYEIDSDDPGRLLPSDIWYLADPANFATFRKVTEKTAFNVGEGLPGRVLASKEPAWIVDVTNDSHFPRAKLARDFGIKGGFGIPVLVGNEVAAVLEFFSNRQEAPDTVLMKVLAQVGSQIGRVYERVRGHEALARSEQMLSLHLENTPMAAISWNENFVCTSWNTAAEGIFGYSKEEAIGRHAQKLLVPEELHDRVGTLLDSLIHRTGGSHSVNENATKDGRTITCEWFYTPLKDEAGVSIGIASLAQDVTGKKKAEEELQAAKEEAERANAAKSDFLSSMSHELRTPMNAILGFAQLLEYSPGEPLSIKQKSTVDHILKGGRHLLELIEQVLELNKIEAGKLSLFLESVSPRHVIDECLSLIQSRANEGSVEIIDQSSRDRLPLLWTDVTRTKQILLNLLSNAVKYNRKDGKVTLSCKKVSGDMLRISVADTGGGIPADKASDLFMPFERLGREALEIEGTGIGLTITKQLVELLKGEIGYESEEGKGSVFWIDLPLSRKQDAAKEKAQETDAALPEAENHTAARVLYIEDNPINLRFMESMIEQHSKMRLLSAHNAELGLDLASRYKPDLILMDINLPGMSGLEALKKLQRRKETSSIPVIAITAAAMPRDVEAGMKAGFKAYLTKPIDVVKALQVIKDTLKGD